jgi:HSP20 family protein
VKNKVHQAIYQQTKTGGVNMLSRRDPFREQMSFRNAFDRLFDSSLYEPGLDFNITGQLALDVSETEDEYEVKAVIPGINPDDMEVTFSNNTLTIRGETKEEQEKVDARYHLRERRHGSFSRSVTLPSDIKSEDIEASYEAGMLTLRLPKTEAVKPMRIPVLGGRRKMIEGKMTDRKNRK